MKPTLGQRVCDAASRDYPGTVVKVGEQVSEIKWDPGTPSWIASQAFVQNKFIWAYPVVSWKTAEEAANEVASQPQPGAQVESKVPRDNAKPTRPTPEGGVGRRAVQASKRHANAASTKDIAIAMLRVGCTVDELAAATGQQRHSASALVSILKRQYDVTRVGGVCTLRDK